MRKKNNLSYLDSVEIMMRAFIRQIDREFPYLIRNEYFQTINKHYERILNINVRIKIKLFVKNVQKASKEQKKEIFNKLLPLAKRYLRDKKGLTNRELLELKRLFSDALKSAGIVVSYPILGLSGTTLLGYITNKLSKGRFSILPSKISNVLEEFFTVLDKRKTKENKLIVDAKYINKILSNKHISKRHVESFLKKKSYKNLANKEQLRVINILYKEVDLAFFRAEDGRLRRRLQNVLNVLLREKKVIQKQL